MATFADGFYPAHSTEKIVDCNTIATTRFVNGVFPGRSHGNIGGLHTVSTNSLPKKTILPGRRQIWCIIGVVVLVEIIICLALALVIRKKIHRFNCVNTPLGQEYTGTIAVTKAGIMCQRWDSQYPQVHTDNDPDYFPEDSLEAAVNYCRNPDDDPLGNWCYTSDPDISWDFCAIPNCDVYEDACSPSPCHRGDCELTELGYKGHCPEGYYGINCEITPTMPLNETVCKQTTGGKEYTGQLAVTLSGRTCQRWDSNYPHRHQGFEEHEAWDPSDVVGSSSWAHNYCRNPGGWLFGPWCYTTDPDVEWEFCAVPFCSTLETAFCRITNFGKEYVGTTAVTVTGLPCISWELGIPYGSDNDDPEEFPEDSIRDAKNYCRNPVWELLGPWCYVDHPDMDWQYCSVPMCSGITDPCEQRPCLNGYCQSRGFAYTCHCDPGHYGKHCETPRTVDPSKCKITDSGTEYNGTLAVSMSGLECQRWDSDFPHVHTAKNPIDFHVYYLGDVHNYCRNPEYDDNGLWCYTTSPTIRWEYCSVPYC